MAPGSPAPDDDHPPPDGARDPRTGRADAPAPGGIGLVVNCYERTYRTVLSHGYFTELGVSNQRSFEQVTALINNVDDPGHARSLAQVLLRRGEITHYAFVTDHVGRALAYAGLPRRVLRHRPFLLDYGLVMPFVTDTEWVLGWDAETWLAEPVNWVDPAVDLLRKHPRVFHASLAWQALDEGGPDHHAEEVGRIGAFSLNWGFSDQVFLVRREDMMGRVYRHFAPAAMARHAPHPTTFEYRMECHQRALRRPRATYTPTVYRTNTIPGGVLSRIGMSPWDRTRMRALYGLEHHVLTRLPPAAGPRWTSRAPASGV